MCIGLAMSRLIPLLSYVPMMTKQSSIISSMVDLDAVPGVKAFMIVLRIFLLMSSTTLSGSMKLDPSGRRRSENKKQTPYASDM